MREIFASSDENAAGVRSAKLTPVRSMEECVLPGFAMCLLIPGQGNNEPRQQPRSRQEW